MCNRGKLNSLKQIYWISSFICVEFVLVVVGRWWWRWWLSFHSTQNFFFVLFVHSWFPFCCDVIFSLQYYVLHIFTLFHSKTFNHFLKFLINDDLVILLHSTYLPYTMNIYYKQDKHQLKKGERFFFFCFLYNQIIGFSFFAWVTL